MEHGTRRLEEGAASYYLAMKCYEHFDKMFSPTIKQGVCALRAAWIFDDLHRRDPNENYDYLSLLLYRKARFLYEESINRDQKGVEPMSGLANMGPDMDRNYGYDGVLYLNPGSAGPRRFTLPVALARLEVDGTRVSASLVELPI